MSALLGSGNEAKQRSLLGAGDDTTEGARQTGSGLATYSRPALAIVAAAISSGVSVLGGAFSGNHYLSGGVTSQGFNTGIIER